MAGIKLRDYQLEAVKKMKNGCILCGGVGSGKSRTSLAYYYMLNGGQLDTAEYEPMDDVNIKDLYIITTARKRDTLEWEQELSHFLLSTNKEINLYTNTVIVDSWNNIKKYTDIENAFFIFDEQRVVGSGAWVKAFYRITKNNQWILLSATPGDTWFDYIPVFVANGFFRNKTEFVRDHVIYSRFTKYPKIDRYINDQRLIRLRNKILINMDFKRQTTSHHHDIYCNFDKFTYKDICKNRWNLWNDEPIKNASEFCYCLRKIVNSSDDRSIKVLEIFEKHPRLIIFYNFDYELDLLKSLYYGSDVEITEWNGHKHQPIPENYDIDGNEKRWIYLVQYTAGAEGWNCITTDTIIFFSQNYSYKILAQACGRIDRMNTPFTNLYYYHLKSHSGIDMAINRALKNKKKFNETKFSGNNTQGLAT